MPQNADPIRASFVARFGESNARAVEEAAQGHYAEDESVSLRLDLPVPIPTAHSQDDFGSSPFRYWFLLAIGRQCVSAYREHHGITAPEEDMRDWALTEGKLVEHDGDLPDYIAVFVGQYKGWVPVPADHETRNDPPIVGGPPTLD